MEEQQRLDIAKLALEAMDRDFDSFFETLWKSEDIALVVLRFHFLTEYQLERIIVAYLPRGDRVIDHAALRYQQKLELAHSLCVLPDEIVGSLRKLNSLRNAFSHKRDVSVGMSEIEEVGRPLGRRFLEIRREHGGDLRACVEHTFVEIYKPLFREVFRLENTDCLPPTNKDAG